MLEKRIFSAIGKAKNILPVWALPFLAVAFTIVGEVLFGMTVIVPLVALGYMTLSADTGLDSHQLLLLSAFAFTSLIVFAWVKWVEQRPIKTLGFYKKGAVRELLVGSGIGLLMYVVTLGIQWLLGGVRLESVDVSFDTLAYVLVTIPFWIIQGGTEEIVTRGWLLPTVTYRANLVVGLLISSSLFMVLHLGNPSISWIPLLDLFLFGIFTGLYMLDRDSIWGVVGLHAFWNFAQGNLFGVEVSGQAVSTALLRFKPTQMPDWLTGGAFGTEGSLISSLILLVGIAILYRRIDFDKLALKAQPVDKSQA